MDYMIKYFEVLIALTIDMAPYLLLGFLFAGILKVLVPPNIMNKYLGKSNTSSVVNATLFGIPLPLCSCGVLPTGISLYKNGASKGSSVSFLISTPQTGIDSILVTWSMLGLPMAIIRPVVAFFTGIMGGLITNKVEKQEIKTTPVESNEKKSKFSITEIFRYAGIEMVNDIAKWLVIGLLIAAFITVIVPDNFFKDFNITGITGMLLILIVSIPLYICATASVPIAAVLLLKGISPGALLVFLMAGPATNAATMTVIGKNLGRKTLFTYLGSLIAGSIIFGLVIDYLLPASWFLPVTLLTDHDHEMLPEWLSYGSAIILTLLIFNSFLNSAIQKIKIISNKSKSKTIMSNISESKYSVEGMSCVKCKAKVENGILTIPGVKSAVADNENNTLTVVGSDILPEVVKNKITELGYDFNGTIDDQQ